jgi:hypothetical protein
MNPSGMMVFEYESGKAGWHCGLPFDVPPPADSPYRLDRILYLGDDPACVALEVLAILTESGDLLVFHARRMGAQYRRQYEEALRCRI